MKDREPSENLVSEVRLGSYQRELRQRLRASALQTVAPTFAVSGFVGLGVTLLSLRPGSLHDLVRFTDPTDPVFWWGTILPILMAFSGAYGRYREFKHRASRDLNDWADEIKTQYRELTGPRWVLSYLGISTLATVGFSSMITLLFRFVFGSSDVLFLDVILMSATMVFPMVLLLRWAMIRSIRPFLVHGGGL